MLEETVDTTEVEVVCLLGAVVTGVTVSTVDCVVDGITGAAGGCEIDVAVGAEDDVDEEAGVTTEAAVAILGGTIKLEEAVVAELMTAVGIGVIVTLTGD